MPSLPASVQSAVQADTTTARAAVSRAVVGASEQRMDLAGVGRQRHLVWLACDTPDYAQRRALWVHFLALAESVLPVPKAKGKARPAEPPSTDAEIDLLKW